MVKVDLHHSEDEVAEVLALAMKRDVFQIEGGFEFTPKRDNDEQRVSIERDKLSAILRSLSAMHIHDDIVLHSDTTYELIVNAEGPARYSPRRNQPISVSDAESGIEYSIAEVSDEYLVWLILVGHQHNALRELGIGFRLFRSAKRGLKITPEDTEVGALDAIRQASIPLQAVRLQSPAKIPLDKFKSLTSAFLFHLAYNLDLAFVPQRFLEEVTRRGRISRMRRARPGDIDAPRRVYNEDLVNHYVLAISTESPTVQFLSHYHVIEHYFESVYSDDLLEQVRQEMTSPDFSYKRKRDIAKLVKTIKKSLQVRAESITFSEGDALRLCILKFVNPNELSNRIEEYSKDHLSYYEGAVVPFSRGPKVVFSSRLEEQICSELARRIYATRCSLVHSKDGDKARYTPFRDEKALVMEIPLMRFISEMVIVANSQVP